jgi:ABC-type transport system involved in multi-copper enzyme maturation permease subunit
MNWLALRLLRPYLIVAATLSAVSAAFVLIGARVIRQQVDAHGLRVEAYAPDRTGLCEVAVSCLPTGAATTLAQAIGLVAAFVPLLIGLIVGVPLFAREREESTDAFVLTQSVPRLRWLSAKLLWALAAGAICTAAVAVTFRLLAAQYTMIIDSLGYALLWELHRNSIIFMVMQTVFIAALAGIIGLSGGRTLRTLVLSVLAWPVALIAAQLGGLLLGMLAFLLTSWSEPLAMMLGTLVGDETATFAALALAAGTVVAVHIGRRTVAGPTRRS